MIKIAQDWLRVEYSGSGVAPVKLVVPLVFAPGKHSNVRVRVEPRKGVRLGQGVETGDALRQTFSTGWAGTTGGSFFGSVTFERSRTAESPQYSVSMMPDFRGVMFDLPQLKTDESKGVQLAFSVDSYDPDPAAAFFAQVFLHADGAEVQRCEVPQEVHPRAASALVVDGFMNWLTGSQPIRLPVGPFVRFRQIRGPDSPNKVISSITEGWDIVHLASDITADVARFQGFSVRIDDLFEAIDQGDVRLVFLSSCNSVRVVSSFRRSAASALIAATENLTTDYASTFEWEFYSSLSIGVPISESFRIAVKKADRSARLPGIRSSADRYSPMFLDLKRDMAFMPIGD